LILAAAVLITAVAATPPLTIEVSKERIRVHARNAPLVSILEELASRLDVRLVIDGPRPTTPVTASLEGPNLTSILAQLLEPRRMRYATSTRATRVRTLVVVTKSEVRPSGPAPPPEPTSQPFADSVIEPVLPDHVSPPDDAPPSTMAPARAK